MKNLILITMLFSMLSLQSCFNYLNLSDAESLGKGNNSLEIEAETSFYKIEDTRDLKMFSAELKYARGLTDRFDLGVYVNTNKTLGLHSKYQLYDSKKFDMSIGMDAKMLYSTKIAQFTPTLYLTKRFKYVNIVINPAFYARFNEIAETSYFPSFSAGIGLESIPLTIGYSFKPFTNAEPYEFHGFGLNYRHEF